MFKAVATVTVLIASLAAAPAFAADSIARFEGGIGSQPLRAGGAPNLVQGVSPGGTPWVIASLSADAKYDGRISAAGRGLLLAGGNSVGRSNALSVRARLYCNGIAHDSDAVTLEDDGDFRIEGVLTPLPPPVCTPSTLLIVSTGGNWFAAGIPKR